MIDIVINLLTGVINVLPISPFQSFIDKAGAIDSLGYLNWFIPFDIFFEILSVWSVSMFTYYFYRFIKGNAMKG